jgi:predicted histone-like DNA-binding protein
MTDTIDLEAIADRIQRNCTAKMSDVKAVLTELIETMRDELQNSHRVKINGFGSFRIGLTSKVADSPKDFKVKTNITGLHVVFQPEVKTSADGTRTKTFLTGTQVKEYDAYEKEEDEESTEPEG